MAFVSLLPTPVTDVLHARLIVVMPIFNEAANIQQVLKEWTQCLDTLPVTYQWLLLNDGSRDATLEVLRTLEMESPQKIVVVDKLNGGHGPTCRLGYDCAATSQAEWILQIDSDGQCDSAYFPLFWEKVLLSDCIFGRRVSRADGFLRRVTSAICNTASSLICGHDMGDANVPYRLMRREILARALTKIPRHFNIHNVALTYVLKRTPDLRWNYIPIHFRDRQGGTNSIDLLAVLKLGFAMLFELLQIRTKPS